MKQWEKLRLFFSIVWRTSHAYVLLMASSVLLAGAQVLLNVLLPKFLIDELTGALRGEYLLLYAGMIVGLNLVLALLNSAVKRGLDEKELYVNNMMDRVMAEKVMKVPFGCLETPEYLDLKERALFAFNNQSAPYQMIRNTAQFLQSALIIITTLAVMLTLSPVLVLLLMLCVAANLFAYSRVMQDQLKFYASLIPINRKYGYYVNLGFQDTLQKDVRLYDMSGMISGRVTDYGREISGECDQFYKKMGRFQGLSGALNDLQSALAYGYAGLRVLGSLSGKAPISLGSLTMYVSAAASFAKAATDAGASAVTITAMLGYLEPFLQFMSLPEESDFGGTLPFPETVESIRFEHVSFRYPGSETRVLHDVSFEIRGGEKISIVGLNGAGKTTLVKLISRLYRPEDAPWVYSCVGKFGNVAKRRVNTIFDKDIAPWSNMVLGEVLNDRGNWSGYLPHRHPQPECYYFKFDRPEGFGASFVGDQVFKSVDNSFSAIPGGCLHPQAVAPGFQMYTCWMIRHLDGNPWLQTTRNEDERYLWLHDAQE